MKAVALRLFVQTSYAGASLQQIADAAGYSKSSVLYHFASKEALLEAALTPAVTKLGALLDESVGRVADENLRTAFVEEFIDYMLVYGLEAHIIINQGQSLSGIPIVEHARGFILRLGEAFKNELSTTEQRVRLGVALAGAAYVVATTVSLQGEDFAEPLEDSRSALIDIVTELLAPLAASSTVTR